MNLTHPRRAVSLTPEGRVTEWARHSVCGTQLGGHGCRWLCCPCITGVVPCLRQATSCCGGFDAVPSSLSEYGLGVGLYFKQLKYLAFVFFFMTLINVPSGLIFWYGNGLLDSTVTATDSLALLTIGNLGEGESTCNEVGEGDTFSLRCAPGAVIGKVEAYYGTGRGSCNCPVDQTPTPACGGTVSGDFCALSPGGAERTKYCHLSSERSLRLPSGDVIEVGACCSDRIVDNRPDFSPLDINVTQGCSSHSAQRVFAGVCLGQAECSGRVSSAPSAGFSWTPQEKLGTDCRGAVTADTLPSSPNRATYDAASGKCTDTLTASGGLDSCPDRFRRRLLIVGTCFATELSLGDGWWVIPKSQVGVFVSLFDFASTLLFLVAAFYLASSEKLEALTRVRMTAADFSIYLPFVPGQREEGRLREDLQWHFTDMVRQLRTAKGLDVSDVPLSLKALRAWNADPTGGRVRRMMEGRADVALPSPRAVSTPRGTHRRADTIGADTDVRFPVVADVNFGFAQGRKLQLMIKRGELLRQLEYKLMKLRIRKAELMTEALSQLGVRVADEDGHEGTGGIEDLDDAEITDEQRTQAARVWVQQVAGSARVSALRADARKIMSGIERINLFIDAERRKNGETSAPAAAGAASGPGGTVPVGVHAPSAEPGGVPDESAVTAFVTFTSTLDRALVLEAYQAPFLLRTCRRICRKGPRLALRAGNWIYPITVRAAPAPSDVKFENQQVSKATRCFRQFVTLLATLVILGVAAVALYLTEDTKRSLLRANPPRDCRTFDEAVVTNQTAAVRDTYWQFFGSASGNTGILECYCRNVLESNAGRLLSEVFVVPVVDASRVPTTQANFPEIEQAAQDGTFVPGAPVTTREAALCADWFNSFLQVQSLIYGSAAITLVVNIVVRGVISSLVSWERLGSLTDETASRALKLFLLQFLNTGALILILNAQIDSDFEVLRRGEHRDYSAAWYRTVGVALTIVMLANVVIPHLTPLAFCGMTGAKLCWDRRCSCDKTITRAVTEQQLVEQLTGPEFLIAERIAQIYTTIFVCVVYSTGLPLLLAVATVSMLGFWATDFMLFVCVYRKPAPIDGSLSGLFASMLPFAAILHMAMGMWMMTHPSIFPPDDALSSAARFTASLGAGQAEVQEIFGTLSDFQSLLASIDGSELAVGERVSRTHALPHLALLLLTLFFLVFNRLIFATLRSAVIGVVPCLGRLECCMTTFELLNSRTVRSQQRRNRRKLDSEAEGRLPQDDGSTVVSSVGGESGEYVDAADEADEAAKEGEAAAAGIGNEAARGGVCCCGRQAASSAYAAGKPTSRRRRGRRSRRPAELDSTSLLYRIENGMVPTYWQALPTLVLEEVRFGRRVVNPELLPLFKKAYAMRTRDLQRRADATAAVATLVREAQAMQSAFRRDIEPAYQRAKRIAQELERRDAAMREAQLRREKVVTAAQRKSMEHGERARRREAEVEEWERQNDTAERELKRLRAAAAEAATNLSQTKARMDAAHMVASLAKANAVLEEGEPQGPLKPSSGALEAAEAELRSAQDKLARASVALRRSQQKAAEARAAAGAGADAEADKKDGEDGDDDDAEAAAAVATAADTDKASLDSARRNEQLEGAKEEAEVAVEAAKMRCTTAREAEADFAKFEKSQTEFWLAGQFKTITMELQLLNTRKLQDAERAAKQAGKGFTDSVARREASLRDAEAALDEYMATLEAVALEARAAGVPDEAARYETTLGAVRAEAEGLDLEGMSAHVVEDEDDFDEV